jgi:hypothetical protein
MKRSVFAEQRLAGITNLVGQRALLRWWDDTPGGLVAVLDLLERCGGQPDPDAVLPLLAEYVNRLDRGAWLDGRPVVEWIEEYRQRCPAVAALVRPSGAVVPHPLPDPVLRPSRPAHGDPAAVTRALAELDRFLAACEADPALDVWRSPVPPAAEDTFEALAQRGFPVPDDLALFYRGGFTNFSIGGEHGELFATFELVPLADVLHKLDGWRGELEDLEEDLERGLFGPQDHLLLEQIRFGLPLSAEQDDVVVDVRTGAVNRRSGEPGDVPLEPIGRSFGEYLVYFVASGCFACGTADRAHFAAWWAHVGSRVPFGIVPADNRWLRHLDEWYGGDITR